jgi:glycogen debranching enzyme
MNYEKIVSIKFLLVVSFILMTLLVSCQSTEEELLGLECESREECSPYFCVEGICEQCVENNDCRNGEACTGYVCEPTEDFGIMDDLDVDEEGEEDLDEQTEVVEDPRESETGPTKSQIEPVVGQVAPVSTIGLDQLSIIEDPRIPLAQSDFAEFEGIRLAFCSGKSVYMVGERDGSFPNFGQQEVEDEMGGIWHQPFKLLDGFWLKLEDTASGETAWLEEAKSFVNLPYGNKFVYDIQGLEVTRFQYCPDEKEGVIIEYQIKNTGSLEKQLELTFLNKIELFFWGLEIDTGVKQGKDSAEWDSENKAIIGKDENNEFYVAIGSDRTIKSSPEIGNINGPQQTAGRDGISTSLKFDVTVPASGDAMISFFVAGATARTKVISELNALRKNQQELLNQKKAKLRDVLSKAKITIPDKDLQKSFDWAKIQTDWLLADVPGIGQGLYGTLPAFPWWFAVDGVHGLRGVLAQGGGEISKNNLRLFRTATSNSNQGGRIIQAAYASKLINEGDPYEVAIFIMGIDDTLQWTGDVNFVREMFPVVQSGINWILSNDENGNLVSEGQVAIEHEAISMEMITTAVYTQQALAGAANMARLLGETNLAQDYQSKADQLNSHINDNYWVDSEGRYAEMYGEGAKWLEYFDEETGQWTTTDTGGKTRIASLADDAQEGLKDSGGIELPEDSIQALESLRSDLSGMSSGDLARPAAWPQLFTALGNIPLEAGLATSERAARSLEKSRDLNDCCYGYEAQGSLAVGECRYGYIDQCLKYVKEVSSKWGRAKYSLAELFDIYPVAYPIVYFVFGIQPQAYEKSITIKPRLPSGWTNIKIENVEIGDTSLDLEIKNGQYIVKIGKGWNLNFDLPEAGQVIVNGKEVALRGIKGEVIS